MGMLDMADHHETFRRQMWRQDISVWNIWERLLGFYDIAMRGKCAALHALGDAYKVIHEAQDDRRILIEANQNLDQHVGYLEGETYKEQQRADALEEENRALETRCSEVANNQETQLGILERLLDDWPSVSGTSITCSTAGDEAPSPDVRFQSIKRALEEAHMAAVTSTSRHRWLQDKYDALEKTVEEVSQRPISQGTESGTVSDLESRSTRLEIEKRVLERELEAERAQSTKKDEQMARLVGEKDTESQEHQVNTNWLKKETERCKDKCAVLQRTVEELKQRLDQEKQRCRSSVELIIGSSRDINATGAGSSAGNIQENLLSEGTDGDIETNESQAVQSNQAAMDEIVDRVFAIMEQVSAKMKVASAAEMKVLKKILAELEELALETDSLVQGRQEMDETQGMIEDELEAIRQAGRLDQPSFQEVGQQDTRQQSAPVEATNPASEHNRSSETVSTIFRSTGPFFLDEAEEAATSADNQSTKYLKAARHVIDLFRMDARKFGPTEATRTCIAKLQNLHKEFGSSDWDTQAGDFVFALEWFLKESLESGRVENDSTSFYLAVEGHDMDLKAVLDLRSFRPKQTAAEQALLERIRVKIRDAEELRRTQTQLITECEAYREEHPLPSLDRGQSEEVVRLARSLAEAADGIWSGLTLKNEEGSAAMETLIAQIQTMTTDPYLAERRKKLQDGIELQERQLAELEVDLPKVKERARNASDLVEAFKRLDRVGWKPGDDDAIKLGERLKPRLVKNESAWLREQHYNQARIDRLAEDRAKAQAFLDQDTANERHHAERLLAGNLLKVQASSPPGEHAEAACFCTLFRYLFPRIYYSTITEGCCAGSGAKPASSSPPHPLSSSDTLTTCQSHHGHGRLPSSGRVWTSVCHVLTSCVWLLFLLLIQPYNLWTIASFLLACLLGLPISLLRLATYTYAYARHRIRTRTRQHRQRQRHHPQHSITQTQTQTPPPPPPPPKFPTPTLPPIPAASTITGALLSLFLVYAWLSYVAVLVERRIWVGNNDWRYAYVLDVTSGKPLPYAGWSPARVDFRLALEPVWVLFAEGVHGLFGWGRG
jgi:hypothetical protein